MKIDLTKKQYNDLLKLVYLGNWMINSYRTDDAEERFEELESHIFSFAEAFGNRADVDYSEASKKYQPSKSLEEKCDDYISEYDNDTFWEDLTDRLAWRDLRDRLGTQQLEQMEMEQVFEQLVPIQNQYSDEFEANGIDNIHVVKQGKVVM